ncbi:hypothetical protein C8Q73DRAFT_297054 [Cubamyces lactineus]|nr:hypothetical protein C8Q73DRAFT_297054 [Cubamyces lactineus]
MMGRGTLWRRLSWVSSVSRLRLMDLLSSHTFVADPSSLFLSLVSSRKSSVPTKKKKRAFRGSAYRRSCLPVRPGRIVSCNTSPENSTLPRTRAALSSL